MTYHINSDFFKYLPAAETHTNKAHMWENVAPEGKTTPQLEIKTIKCSLFQASDLFGLDERGGGGGGGVRPAVCHGLSSRLPWTLQYTNYCCRHDGINAGSIVEWCSEPRTRAHMDVYAHIYRHTDVFQKHNKRLNHTNRVNSLNRRIRGFSTTLFCFCSCRSVPLWDEPFPPIISVSCCCKLWIVYEPNSKLNRSNASVTQR